MDSYRKPPSIFLMVSLTPYDLPSQKMWVPGGWTNFATLAATWRKT